MKSTHPPRVVIAVHQGHRYILAYEAGREADAVREIGKWAADPDLPFTWYHAALLTNRVQRRQVSDLPTSDL